MDMSEVPPRTWYPHWERVFPGNKGVLEYRALILGWQSPGRHYHTLEHLAHALSQLDSIRHPESDEIELALWYHDVVYDVHSDRNEDNSAFWAMRDLRRWPNTATIVSNMVRMTKEHKPETEAERVMSDCDLAILGAADEQYDKYTRNVREEYAFVPDDIFNHHRIQILEQLSSENIYKTRHFRELYEEQAKSNIARELGMLTR